MLFRSDNAIRHAPARSTVTVDLREAAGGYEILVIDSGPGIPPEIQPRIFERFFRLDAARTYDGGAGLGLALVSSDGRLYAVGGRNASNVLATNERYTP